MKKTGIFGCIAVFLGFVSAFVMCVGALRGPKAVASFDETGMRIVLDAGHGGIDGGVTGKSTGVKESDLNLAITLLLKEDLEEMGFEVILTRKTEAGLYGVTGKGFKRRDMEKRKEIIERASPDFVLSIHQNLYPSSSVRGGQVFYTDGEDSRRFAEGIQSRLNELYATEKVKNRAVMQSDLFVLQCTDCPSALVECGFLSNAKDEALLCEVAWQRRISESIARGVLSYLSENSA